MKMGSLQWWSDTNFVIGDWFKRGETGWRTWDKFWEDFFHFVGNKASRFLLRLSKFDVLTLTCYLISMNKYIMSNFIAISGKNIFIQGWSSNKFLFGVAMADPALYSHIENINSFIEGITWFWDQFAEIDKFFNQYTNTIFSHSKLFQQFFQCSIFLQVTYFFYIRTLETFFIALFDIMELTRKN